MYLIIELGDEMSKAKLMNELIKQHNIYSRNTMDKEMSNYFMGFLDACKVVLTEEQIVSSIRESNKRLNIEQRGIK